MDRFLKPTSCRLAVALICCAAPALADRGLEEHLLANFLTPEEIAYDAIIAQCHVHDGVCVNHAPWQSVDEIADFAARVGEPSPTPRYNIVSRIQNTATNGAVAQFSRFTVTYSFVPDGTTVASEGSVPGSTTGPSNLFSTMDAAFASLGGREKWQSLVRESLERFELFTPINFVEVTDDGAQLPGFAGSNDSGSIRGDIRIAMRPIDGAGGTRAYGLFPDVGDIVLDSGDVATWTQAAANHRALRNIVMHNVGHALGLQHVIPASPNPGGATKLMESTLSTEYDGPQQDDILACQANYDDRFGPIGSAPEASPLGTLQGDRTLFVWDASLSIPSTLAGDYFSFDLPDATLPVTVHLSPIGSSYSVGPEGGSTSTYNPRNRRDMNVRLYGQNGTTMITESNATGAGSAEVILRRDLSSTGPGVYHVRVGCSNTTAPQRYRLMVYTDSNANNFADEKDLARVEEAVGADICENAMPIDQNVIYVGTTAGATSDGRANCGNSNQSPDVWFEYTPGYAGNLDVSLCSSAYDTVLSVHRECAETEYTPAACNDDSTICSATGKTSYIQGIPVSSGLRYLVRVSGFSGISGSYALRLRGPDSYYGRENDNDANNEIDAGNGSILLAAFPTFDSGFNYGELQPQLTPFPASLGAPNIAGYQGSAPPGTPEIGFRSTAALNPGFATWRRNLGFPMRFNTIYRARFSLRTDAAAGSSNWVRARLGGDFQETNGGTDYGFVTNAAALPRGATPREVEAWHWSKNDSAGASLPGQPDQPGFAFDIIDESPSIGGHLAAMSSLTIDAIDRADLGSPVILRNRGISDVSRQDGRTPTSSGLGTFNALSGYKVGLINDPGSSVALTSSFDAPVPGAMNLTFNSPATGNQPGFAAIYVDPAVSSLEAFVKISNSKLYCMDVWISAQTSPNTTTTRPPVMRLRWTPKQVSFNQGQVSISSFNLNPDATWDGVYDNPSGLQLGGVAERYTSFWWPSLDTAAQAETDYLYFIDFVFNRTGLSAIRPTGTYSVERLTISEYFKPSI